MNSKSIFTDKRGEPSITSPDMRDKFIEVISHELKTPVTSIKAYAEIIQENLEQQKDDYNLSLLHKLNSQIDKLSTLINELLDVNSIVSDTVVYSTAPLNLNHIIEECIEEMRHSANHKFVLDLGQLPYVNVDKERICQALTNILSNAVKFSPHHSEIIITSIVEDSVLKITVADSGIGIAQQYQERIFDRFFRIDTVPRDTYPGMGLGLYISSQIIKSHGGTICVRSNEGEGAIFQLTLPDSVVGR
jgi:signal transduction histidine kinase